MSGTVPVAELPVISYPTPQESDKTTHHYVRRFDNAIRRGQAIVQTLMEHKRKGLEPDLIITHPGWGDGFFLRTIFPGTPVIGLFEYYYQTRGADVGFDPEFPSNFDDLFRVHSLNATQLLALESCDAGFCPTEWQRQRFPKAYQDRLDVIHEGIDTDIVQPDPTAQITLADGSHHQAGEEIVTYVSRNLEPYRGYHIFMRSLPRILAARPNCKIIITGGSEVSYSKPLPEGQSYHQKYWDEVSASVDTSRIHFTGPLSYTDYLKVLQISQAHIYLTYPFILSWSMLEAMAAGCLVIGSQTPPVQEVIQDGINGRLFPFHEPGTLARQVIETLEAPRAFQHLRETARNTIVQRYDFKRITYPRLKQLIQKHAL
jgi:glycosyltransferase involved in cell wall biosynthesis